MPTNRTPRRRAAQIQVTSRAVEAFRRLLELEEQCTCPPPEYPKFHDLCPACTEWFVQHRIIASEMDARPWEAPCVIEPAEDEQLENMDRWKRGVRERWLALRAALDELKAREAKQKAGRR